MTDTINILVNVLITLTILIIYLRIFWLRSFAKISWIDFACTICIWSLLASTIIWSTSLLQGIVAIWAVFLFKIWASILRTRSELLNEVTENTPLLLMKDWAFIEAALKKSNIDKESIYAKLREANVLQISDVQAVIFETTWDISVLHWTNNVDSELLQWVLNLEK